MKVLYAAAEISPFAKMTNNADLLRFLPASLQDKGYEIRILLPKYGSIHDRRNRLHEVIRLAGIEVKVNDVVESMKIKVASIPNAKLQVYFLDNETYFGRKGMFQNPKTEKAYPDNDKRVVFYNKGIMETVIKLNWVPDIIHCHDWAAGLVPMLLKTVYKDVPNFQNTKVVFNVHSPENHGVFDASVLDCMHLPEDVDTSEFIHDGKIDTLRLGVKYSDFIVTGNDLNGELDHLFEEFGQKPTAIQGAPQDVSARFSDYYREIVPEIQ